MPRDFRWQAEQLYLQAVSLKAKGDLKAAAEKDQQALDIYPYFLRALVLMGTTLAEAGDTGRAASILQFTTQFYPKDPSAQFDFALTLANQPGQQIEALQHALELNPDLTAAYESLGAAQFAVGQPQSAIETFRQGLQVDPLSASLYYNLSLALSRQGDSAGAKRALSLAQGIDPKMVASHSPGLAANQPAQLRSH
jgi:tetratricopeptide (TPR) repeat protein